MATREYRVVDTTTKGQLIQASREYRTSGSWAQILGTGLTAWILGNYGSRLFLRGIGEILTIYSLVGGSIDAYITPQFENAIIELEGLNDSTEVNILREFRYSGRQGGHWIPTNNFDFEY